MKNTFTYAEVEASDLHRAVSTIRCAHGAAPYSPSRTLYAPSPNDNHEHNPTSIYQSFGWRLCHCALSRRDIGRVLARLDAGQGFVLQSNLWTPAPEHFRVLLGSVSLREMLTALLWSELRDTLFIRQPVDRYECLPELSLTHSSLLRLLERELLHLLSDKFRIATPGYDFGGAARRRV